MHKDGNQMIAKATHGQFKNEKELKKFDKENLDVFKQLRQERNQLIGSINRSLRVSGNAGKMCIRDRSTVERRALYLRSGLAVRMTFLCPSFSSLISK